MRWLNYDCAIEAIATAYARKLPAIGEVGVAADLMATTGSADLTAAIGTSAGELAEHSLRRLNGTQVTRRMAMRALADMRTAARRTTIGAP
ncbi:hypothetical protein [Nonomuraea sp. NPDC003201]